MGKDIIGIAQTGTGKTASFVLPMIDILAEGRSRALMPRSLILEPTRELAQQVAENFDKYGKYHKLSMALLIGGVSMGDQLAALEKGVDVLIATPGRLMDLFQRGKILMSGCSLLVIDEADRMLDMGFIPDIEEICSKLPKTRQTLLFSATMPPPIKKLSDQFLTDPKSITVARAASANVNITQWVVPCQPRAKRDTLISLLRAEDVKTAIIFCNRKTMVRDLNDQLKRAGFATGQIHGDMEQADRIRELDRFKQGDITILVASDVAARGLDITGVSHVFNFDVPWHADDYVHRIGRTGRAGRTGTAMTLATADDAEHLDEIEKLIRTKIARWGEGASAAPAAVTSDAAPPAEAPPARNRRARAPKAIAPVAATPSVPETTPAPATPAAGDAEPRRDRRRRGGRDRDAARPAATVAEPRAAEPAAAKPARPDNRRAEPRRHDPRPTGRDPLASYRQIASAGTPVRRRDDDDGESFIGFGPEGVPDFLKNPLRP
jgi:superfamily II DNA/RNA helicase